MLYAQSAHILLRQNLPLRQLQLLEMNSEGGRPDLTDPKYPAWEAKQKKYSKGDPRRIAYRLSDVLQAGEFYAPFMERYERAHKGDNPFDEVPLSVLNEMKAALDEHSTPSWFWSSLPLDKLREAIGVS